MSKLTIQAGALNEALSISQAAAYASIAAKDHLPDSPIGKQMAKLNERLVDLTLIALEDAAVEQPIADPSAPTGPDEAE